MAAAAPRTDPSASSASPPPTCPTTRLAAHRLEATEANLAAVASNIKRLEQLEDVSLTRWREPRDGYASYSGVARALMHRPQCRIATLSLSRCVIDVADVVGFIYSASVSPHLVALDLSKVVVVAAANSAAVADTFTMCQAALPTSTRLSIDVTGMQQRHVDPAAGAVDYVPRIVAMAVRLATRVVARGCGLDGARCAEVADVAVSADGPRVVSLDLSDNSLRTAGAAVVSRLLRLARVASVEARGCGLEVTADDVAAIPNAVDGSSGTLIIEHGGRWRFPNAVPDTFVAALQSRGHCVERHVPVDLFHLDAAVVPDAPPRGREPNASADDGGDECSASSVGDTSWNTPRHGRSSPAAAVSPSVDADLLPLGRATTPPFATAATRPPSPHTATPPQLGNEEEPRPSSPEPTAAAQWRWKLTMQGGDARRSPSAGATFGSSFVASRGSSFGGVSGGGSGPVP